jgi:hypothetical protein
VEPEISTLEPSGGSPSSSVTSVTSGRSGAGSSPPQLKVRYDPDFELCRQTSGALVTSLPPEWYTCLYCRAEGEHFRAVCPRLRPTSRDGPQFDLVGWPDDLGGATPQTYTPGLLGRLQQEYRDSLEVVEQGRAEQRERGLQYKTVAAKVYRAESAASASILPVQRMEDLKETCRKHEAAAAALHAAEAALAAVPKRKHLQRTAATEKAEALRWELREVRLEAPDFFRFVDQLQAEPSFQQLISAPRPRPPGFASAAWAAREGGEQSLPEQLRTLRTDVWRRRLRNQVNRVQRGRRGFQRGVIRGVRGLGTAMLMSYRVTRFVVKKSADAVKKTGKTFKREVNDVAGALGWWKGEIESPPPTPPLCSKTAEQTLTGMGWDGEQAEAAMVATGGELHSALGVLEGQRASAGQSAVILSREVSTARPA